MPHCYLLAISGGSSLDQHSNNITLFNLVEQLNFPKHAPPAPGTLLPLEVHAHFELDGSELNQRFEVRYVLVAESGLESPTETFTHRSATLRSSVRAWASSGASPNASTNLAFRSAGSSGRSPVAASSSAVSTSSGGRSGSGK